MTHSEIPSSLQYFCKKKLINLFYMIFYILGKIWMHSIIISYYRPGNDRYLAVSSSELLDSVSLLRAA